MSANAQNYAYVFGKKKLGAKMPVITKARIEEIRKRSGKYLARSNHENKT